MRASGLTRTRGFTLMEIVVALSLLATSGLVLFAWIQQNLETARRIQEAQARAQLQLEGSSWLSLINPIVEPQGERQQGNLRLDWTSTPLEPPRNEFSYGENIVPRWELGLYQVHARLRSGEAGAAVEWNQIVTGWRPATRGGDAGGRAP